MKNAVIETKNLAEIHAILNDPRSKRKITALQTYSAIVQQELIALLEGSGEVNWEISWSFEEYTKQLENKACNGDSKIKVLVYPTSWEAWDDELSISLSWNKEDAIFLIDNSDTASAYVDKLLEIDNNWHIKNGELPCFC